MASPKASPLSANSNTQTFTPTLTGTLSNAGLANSTISGVALGGTLNALSHNSTLSGTSYTGSALVSDWGLNLASANFWTGLQNFTNASTSQFTATSSVYLATLGGSVGIGNATPGKTLDVTGTGRFSSTLTLTNASSCSGGSALQTNWQRGDIPMRQAFR